MHPSPTLGSRVVAWASTLLLPVAAWISSSSTLLSFHVGAGLFFATAASLSAGIGGMTHAAISIVLNVAAFNIFTYLNQPGSLGTSNILWSLLQAALALTVGYAREKRLAAETLAGGLSKDLARLRGELELQRSDLKRFHDLSFRLSSHLDPQRVLNDVLTSIANLQRTDLAMLLLLPERSSKILRVDTSIGFTAEQLNLFGEISSSSFSLERRELVEDVQKPGARFRFPHAAVQVGFRTVFSTPIINRKGEPLGAVVTFFREPTLPGDRQSRMVELYARQAANALDNARLYRGSLETLAAEQHRTAVLRSLAEASVQINSALAVDSVLQAITDQARKIIGARHAFTTLLAKGSWSQSMTCVSAADGEPAFEFPQASSEMFMLACTLGKPVRLSAATEANRPWRSINKTQEAARRGWLAAPLLTRDGRNLGLIQLADKIEGEFSSDDEALLVQLAHMASVAIDNVRLYREIQEQLAETKRTQEALERSKETVQLAQEWVGIGIGEWDLESGELVWSEEIRRLHGMTAEMFDGRYGSWMESIHPEDRHQVHQAITEAMAANGEYEVQYRVVFPDKSLHWLEARGRTMVMGGTPVRMLGVALDITALKLSEEALRSSEKLAATGRLAASIAHEINNPLAAVTNALYILRTTPQLSNVTLEYIKTAETELARVVHITKQTLGLYREIAAPVLTSIPRLLEEVLAAYDTKIAKSNISVHKLYRGAGQLRAFPGELRQVFSNLVLNALEAVPAGGVVSVRMREAHAGQDRRGIKITVADNGPGISAANMPRLFEPFFTTKESKGTGLGLWVSQGIVQKHGGVIRVRSSTGASHHGTCFVIFMPWAAADERVVREGPQRAPGGGPGFAVRRSANDVTAA
jgi:PAS domain S-box-containing protein